jgi:phospholipid transport system substrate-binding protein
MKLLRLFLVAIAICSAATVSATPTTAATQADAGKYIESIGSRALAIISDKALDKAGKQTKLEAIFSESVDFNWVSRFVMGRYWRQATDAQKARYTTEYKKFLILNYTSRFTQYSSGSFKVTSSKDTGNNEFLVNMQIQAGNKNSDPVYVDYRVRANESGFKIFDVIVEGVSLLATQRSEFGSVLANEGIDHLIDQLVAKSKTGDVGLPGAKP